jgi:hypothetical protein
MQASVCPERISTPAESVLTRYWSRTALACREKHLMVGGLRLATTLDTGSQQLCLRQVLNFILCRIHKQFCLNPENPVGTGELRGKKNRRIL